MFTGLVAAIGTVESAGGDAQGAGLRIATELAAELAAGDSIAVNGACLTASSAADGHFEADVMPQTLSLTTLGALRDGDPVNLELPLRAGDRLGGHIVQGHVDAVGEVTAVEEDGNARRLRISLPAKLLPLVAERGSIAIDGVSLTVAAIADHEVEVSLIPETLERTTLGARAAGEKVNVECDIVARYLQRQQRVV